MGNNTPLISIIRVVKNELPNLKESFPVILNQQMVDDFEIIIIDSASSDGSVQYVNELIANNENIRLFQIEAEDFHHAKTRNYGAQLAKGKYLVYLGGDAIPTDKYWLANLIKPLVGGAHNNIAAVYGKQIPRADADISNICRMTFNYGDKYIIKSVEDTVSSKEMYFFSTVNCCINRDMIKDTLFDERVPIDEDVTLSYKIINSGMKIVYCPDSCVCHSHNYNYAEIFQRYFDNAVLYKKIGIFKNGDSSINRDGIRYLRHAIGMLKNRSLKDWFEFGSLFCFSTLGVKLGQNYELLPKWLSSKFSKSNTV